MAQGRLVARLVHTTRPPLSGWQVDLPREQYVLLTIMPGHCNAVVNQRALQKLFSDFAWQSGAASYGSVNRRKPKGWSLHE